MRPGSPNKKAPIVAVLKFFYGLHVPIGSVYMLKPNGNKVVKLLACTKTGGRTAPRALRSRAAPRLGFP